MSCAKDGERPLIDQAVAGNSPVYGPGWEFPLVVAQRVAGKPGLFLPGRTVYFCPFQPGVQQDDALRLRQGLGERAGGQESGPAGGAAGPRRARNDRGGLLELLDLVVEGDTLVVTHIDRLSRGLTHGLQVIEGLPSFCAGAYHGVGWNHNATNGGDGMAEEQKGRDVLEKLLREIATGTASGPVPTATERMRAAVALASLGRRHFHYQDNRPAEDHQWG